jgi:ribosomal protein S18 acetylase RimI-like enzyme
VASGLSHFARRSGALCDAARVLSSVFLRRAEPGDNDAVAEVHVRSWQVGYRGLLPDEYLDVLDPVDRASRYTFADMDLRHPQTKVSVDGDEICGFATVGPCRDEDMPSAGELYGIYVHPDWWNRGVGRILINDARERLFDLGFHEAVLWVLVGNERAERFYHKDRWSPDGQRRLAEVHGITVDEIRYRRPLP